MPRVLEITTREYDNKWIAWELMDSFKKNGIGKTATWPRFKWVITAIWHKQPRNVMKRLEKMGNLVEIQERLDGKRTYVYNLDKKDTKYEKKK